AADHPAQQEAREVAAEAPVHVARGPHEGAAVGGKADGEGVCVEGVEGLERGLEGRRLEQHAAMLLLGGLVRPLRLSARTADLLRLAHASGPSPAGWGSAGGAASLCRSSLSAASRTPLTNAPDCSVPKRFASSTASSTATFGGRPSKRAS